MEEEPTTLDDLITTNQNVMSMIDQDSEKYATRLTYLERLYKLKRQSTPERVSRDTMAMIGGNLLGILVIVAYERAHVMTSKGLSQLIRLK